MAMVLEKTAVETPKRPTKRWVITKAFTDQNALNPAMKRFDILRLN